MNKSVNPVGLEAALEHHKHGEHERAESLYREIIAVQPRNADALQYAGFLALETGRFDLAVDRLTQSIACGNHQAQLYLLLGRAQKGAGRIDAAIACYRRALMLDGRLVDAHVSLGIAYRADNQLEDAARSYRNALTLNPLSFEANFNLAKLLQAIGEIEDAVGHYGQAERLRPGSAELQYEYGAALALLGRRSEAAERLNRAIERDEDMLKAYGSLAELLNIMKQHDAARTFFEALIGRLDAGRGRPNDAAARANLRREAGLGCIDALLGASRHDEALEALEAGLRDEPEAAELLDRLLLVAPYRYTSQADLVGACRRFQRVSPFKAVPPLPIELRDAEPERLRIGYISADFRGHSVAYFIEPLLACHDRSRFAVVCYSSNPKDDDITARLRGYVDEWVEARSLANTELAARIAADEIDVLVDLSGRTEGGRARALAEHPACVQIAYLGFPTYTAFQQLEFRLTDAVIDPVDTDDDGLPSERPLRLPQSMFCYRPPDGIPTVENSASEGAAIRFGSFNQSLKLSPVILRTWAEILNRVPESVLILKSFAFDDEAARVRVAEAFTWAGGNAERIETRPPNPRKDEHFGSYNRIDIALDTFPYNGATTTCEALWMGVPVVTLAGETHASRMGASLLGALGLEELVTYSTEEYVDAAVALAKDPAKRAALRGTLRLRFEASCLRDETGFARGFESTVREAWRARWSALRAERN